MYCCRLWFTVAALFGVFCLAHTVPVRRNSNGAIETLRLSSARPNAAQAATAAVAVATANANRRPFAVAPVRSQALQELEQSSDEVFVVTLAEYVAKKFRHLAAQYARLQLDPSATSNEIDVLDLTFLTEATAFLRHSMLPFTSGYPSGTQNRPVDNMNLAQLKAALARRTQAQDEEDDEDIVVEEDDGRADEPVVAFRSLVNPLPHMCKLEKYKNFRLCKPGSS